ncbi:hypothetical protein QBC39DRAFT_358055, partial [Podospora conica]
CARNGDASWCAIISSYMASRITADDESSSLVATAPEVGCCSIQIPHVLKQPCLAPGADPSCPEATLFGPRCRSGRDGLVHGCRVRERGRRGRRGLGCAGTVPISGSDCWSRRACDRAHAEFAVGVCHGMFGLAKGSIVAAIRWERRGSGREERASMRGGCCGRQQGRGARWRHVVIELRGLIGGGTSGSWRTERRQSRCRPSRASGVGRGGGFVAPCRSGVHGSCSMSCSGRGTGERARAADEASSGGGCGRAMP